MNSYTHALALAIGLALAGTAGADTPVAEDPVAATDELIATRRELNELSRRMAELSAKLGNDEARVRVFRSIGDPDRAVIGVVLGESDKNGVRIEGVTPGGPADTVGLRAGDSIKAIRGHSLDGPRPVKALRDAMADLRVGDKVDITYVRDGKAINGKIQAEAQGLFSGFGNPTEVFSDNSDDFEHLAPDIHQRVVRVVTALGEHGTIRRFEDAPDGNFNMMNLASVSGLRLTSMNAGLGRYFGVDSGALVLEVESDEYKGLQAGDVILEVDGRAVKDPRETLRALGKFEPDQKVELKLQRDRVPQLVKVSVPEKSRAFLMPPPAPPAPPAPPRMPTPPAPPTAAAPIAIPNVLPAASMHVAPLPVAAPSAPMPPLPPIAPTPPEPPAPSARIMI